MSRRSFNTGGGAPGATGATGATGAPGPSGGATGATGATGSAGTGALIYRQGGVSSGNVFATWAEIEAAALVQHSATRVLFDNSITPTPTIPGTADLNGLGRLTFGPASSPSGQVASNVFVTVLDGAKLTDIAALEPGLTVRATPTTTIPFRFSDGSRFTMTAATMSIIGAATLPMCRIQTNTSLELVMDQQSILTTSRPATIGGIGVFEMAGPNTTLQLSMYRGSVLAVNTVRSAVDPSNALSIFQDASGPDLLTGVLVQFIAAVGQPPIQPIDQAPFLRFNGDVVPRLDRALPSGYSAVNPALVALKGSRPVLAFTPNKGSPGAREYTVWTDLIAAAAQSPGYKAIVFDGAAAPGGICDVPAGTWSFNGPVDWFGTPSASVVGTTVRFAPDVFLPDTFGFHDISPIVRNTTAAVITITGAAGNLDDYAFSGNGTFQNTGTKPLFDVANSAVVGVDLAGFFTVVSGAFLAIDVGGTATLRVADRCSVGANTVNALGTFNVRLTDAGTISYTQTAGALTDTQVAVEGTYVATFTNADLTAGILTVAHALAHKFVASVAIYDNTGASASPIPRWTPTTPNALTVDLSGFGAIAGTWTVVVKR